MANKPGHGEIKGIFKYGSIKMADYKKNNFNNMSLKSLGEELHGLRNVGVPEKLKNALFSSIPCEEPVETQELHKVRWLELCGISSFATAAVAMILTLVLMQTGNKSLTSQAAVIDRAPSCRALREMFFR